MNEETPIKMKVIERFREPTGLYLRWGDLQRYLQWLEEENPEEAPVIRRVEQAILATVIHRGRGKPLD